MPSTAGLSVVGVADCVPNADLKNGLATYIWEIVDMAASARTADNRPVVKSFSWFNIDRDGGTYNLRLFDDAGHINPAGEACLVEVAELRVTEIERLQSHRPKASNGL